MYVVPDSTASYATPEAAQYDFSHGLHGVCTGARAGVTARVEVITGRERRRRWHPAEAVMGDCQAAAAGVSRCFQCQGRSSCRWEAG